MNNGGRRPVTIRFEANGTPHIQASTDHDLFWTIGHLQARYRLTQMDLTRRQGEGSLAEVPGARALISDQFQVTLGLERAAQRDWQDLAPASPARQILQAFADGVNAWMDAARESHALPLLFHVLNYQPRPWTPIDTLVIQGVMTQDLALSTTSLRYALLTRTPGYERTMQWFPLLPVDRQQPYDPRSFQSPAAPTPLPSQLAFSQASEQQIAALPGAQGNGPASNNWAANGPLTASGQAMMAGDPHLRLSLPSIWYQLAGSSPGYHFSGVSIPGVPLPLIGRNQHISWSMTDVQNQSTIFYVEKTDRARPQHYYWNGAWRPIQHLVSTIKIKGRAPLRQDVYLTVHGPLLPAEQGLAGETISLDWTGALPSTDSAGIVGILQATSFAQFRQALCQWTAPTLNFIYADDQGHIGMISPGFYPIIRSGAPWLPLPGTGEADIVPQVYDPPDHLILSANQRPVSVTYPYYIGTTWNDFDNGYRANEIAAEPGRSPQLTQQDMERIQLSVHDYLAGLIVPALLRTLHNAPLRGNEQTAVALVESWNENMDVNSSAAAIWWTFWTRYLTDTFGPWWAATPVPSASSPALAVGPGQSSLDEDLEAWTLHDPHNRAVTLPAGVRRDAPTVMLQTFRESVALLSTALGSDPRQWRWGNLHTRSIPSLPGADSLGYGPRPGGGDLWTPNAVGGSQLGAYTPALTLSAHGPSWRMIVDWGSCQAESTYPGGQDENPASPWYANQISTWWDGAYSPMLSDAAARTQAGSVAWTISA